MGGPDHYLSKVMFESLQKAKSKVASLGITEEAYNLFCDKYWLIDGMAEIDQEAADNCIHWIEFRQKISSDKPMPPVLDCIKKYGICMSTCPEFKQANKLQLDRDAHGLDVHTGEEVSR